MAKIEVRGIAIKHKMIKEKDYISLSDIARFREGEYPSDVIRTWMRTYRTIEFLGIWEKLHNPDFNSVEFDRVKNEAPENGFIMTPKRRRKFRGGKNGVFDGGLVQRFQGRGMVENYE